MPVEETYRENADNKNECQLVLLDAKSAFDVVMHSHLMRRVYHAGIQDKHWSLINSMHQKASSSVKWDNKISQQFPVTQGVRQGGILSSDLYKVYINPLLNNLSDSYLGMKIGNVNCNASACADDVALMSRREHETQVMINIAHEFATMEGYKLQPAKSVIINIQPNKRKQSMMDQEYILENNVMPNVKQAIHLGIIRTNTLADNMTVNVEENIKKSRRSAYGLFGGGFHGNNGLDPETLIHLFNTYITPVLMYGMELIIPKTTALEQLERYQKKLLKQLLSLPPNTPDPAVYLLSGTLPVEAQLHIRALNFFNNICNQEEKSIEKLLARQQLRTKTINSNSWFIEIKKMLIKYNLQDPEYYLDNPMTKRLWITSIKREIQNYWQELITSMASYYPRLKYLNSADYRPGNIHPLLKIKCSSSIEISRIPPKLKMLTGTYILQTIRTKMYADEDAKCQLCKVETETLEHLLLNCTELSNIRNPILRQIQDIFLHHTEYDLCQQSTSVQMQILLDITRISKVLRLTDDQIRQIEYQIRRLIYALHSERYKILNIHWKLKKRHK